MPDIYFFHVNQLKQIQILKEVTGPGAFSKTDVYCLLLSLKQRG